MNTLKNSVQLLGRLGQEVEVKISNTGVPYCFISLVTNEYGVKKNGEQYEKSQWHRIAIWGDMLCNQMKKRGKKGSLWLIQGTIFYKQFEREKGNPQQYCEIRANKLMFLMEAMGLNKNIQPEISA